jgi:FtsZ-binding cell division protein ZapB
MKGLSERVSGGIRGLAGKIKTRGYGNSNVAIAAAAAVLITSAVAGYLAFTRMRAMELDFNEKKAVMVRETLDLKDSIDDLQEAVRKSSAELHTAKVDNEELNRKYSDIEVKYDELMSEKDAIEEEAAGLREKYDSLSGKVDLLEKSPLVDRIRNSAEKEQNPEIRKVLQAALRNIEIIQKGGAVELPPIVIGPGNAGDESVFVGSDPAQYGKVLSLDARNNLVVVDLGRRENITEGSECMVLRDDKQIARGEVISVRYRISAVHIEEMAYKYDVSDIREGDKAAVRELDLF